MSQFRAMAVLVAAAGVSACAFGAQRGASPRTGEFGGQLRDPETDAPFMRYSARVPKKILSARTRAGLLVLLHGIGGHEKQLVGTMQQALSAAGRGDEYVLVGMKSRGNGWENVDHEPIRKTVAWALATYPIDPSRVFALGYSHGAIRLGVLGAEAQDIFAGVIMWAGMCSKLPEDDDPANTALQYYIVHGERDPTVGPANIRAAVKKMASRGIRHVYHEIAGGDHGAPFSNGARKHLWPDMVKWCDAIRNRRVPLDDAGSKRLDALRAKLDGGKYLSSRDVVGLSVMDGPEAMAAVADLLRHKSSSVRYAAARICTTRYFGPTVTNVLVEMVNEKDTRLRKAVLEALWMAAGLRCPEAIRAVVALATDADAKLSARAAAITILKDVRMPKGFVSNPDPAVEAAFAEFAQDSNPRLRAFAAMP